MTYPKWRHFLSQLCVFALVFSTLLGSLPIANAVSTIQPTVVGLSNQFNPNVPIKASSSATAVVKVQVTASQNSQTLTSIQANFSGSGFTANDLEAIATGASSGVALYGDGGGTAGSFDGTDTVVTLAASPDWSPGTTNIILTPATPVALNNSGVVTNFYVVIKTSGTASSNDVISATIPVNGVVTSDGSGPSTAFTANSFKVDTTAPTISGMMGSSGVNGYVGSPTLDVRFSEPVQKVGYGNIVLGDSPFTFTDNGTSGGSSISAISHNAGQDFATVTLNSNLDSGDLDGSPSTLAAGTNKIMDMAGNVMGTTAKNFESMLKFSTVSLPGTFVGASYSTSLVAVGGTGGYTYATAGGDHTQILSNLGLSLAANGTLSGTVANATGSHTFQAKVTDSGATDWYQNFTINISSTSGASVPGISSVAPHGGAQSGNFTLTITGSNTSFTGSSVVTVSLPPGEAGTNGISLGSVTAGSSTSISVPVTISADAAVGPRDVKVVTGSQVVNMPGGFNVFASGASGLTLLSPSDNSFGVAIPPGFTFNPTSNGSANSYRITVKSGSDFSTATTVWDYVFPKPSDGQNTNGSHCTSTSCSIGYGAGTFNILTQPAPIAPQGKYYWQVSTYSEAYASVTTQTASLESTPLRSFFAASSVTDTFAPNIIHRPITSATASTDLDLFARVMDNVATRETNPALTATIYYCATANCTPGNATAGTYVGNGYYKFRIPSGTISTAGTLIRYYLAAGDGANTSTFKKTDNTPFSFTSVASSAQTIAGTVKDSTDTCASGVQTATVFVEGTGAFADTNGSCAFTISGLPAGTYDLVAIKEGYSERFIMGTPTGSTGVAFKLASGVSGGFGGDTSKPKVQFSAPFDGTSNIPSAAVSVIIGFNESMSQNSVTKSGNITIKEVNNATGETTDITSSKGSLTYYPTTPEGGSLPPMNNLAVWSGTNLGDGKTIAVIVSPDVTDTAGNQIQGNQPDGSYVFSFSTGSTVNTAGFNTTTNTFASGGTFGVGANVPPHVKGTVPAPGAFSIPTNLQPKINFSTAMKENSESYNLKTYVKLYTVAAGVETDVSTAALDTVAIRSSGNDSASVTIKSTYNGGFLAASTTYRLKVLGGALSGNGIPLAPPGQESNIMFVSEFKTGSGVNVSAPTIIGSFPSDGDTGVPVNLGAINIAFSHTMDESSINSNSFYLSAGSSIISGTVVYKGDEKQAYFIPSSSLSPNTDYTLTATTSIKAFNQVALANTATLDFTTSASSDSTAPTVAFVNADDHSIAITYSEPMNAAKAIDASNWTASVRNISNYSFKYGLTGFASGAGTSINIPSSAVLEYDAVTNTILIKGYNNLTAADIQGKEILVTITGVKDRSGNAITVGTGTNTSRAPINNSATTKGALTPMDLGTSSFASGGQAVPTHFSTSTFGFAPPVEVRPFNMMAGQTTIYGVRLPISKQIPAGGQIHLTFPTGFDVSGAKQDTNSPMRSDLNGPGTGTPTFKCNGSAPKSCGGAATVTGDDSGSTAGGATDDGVTVNTSSRTVVIHLSAVTNSAGNDFLNIDIAGIKNSTSPKDFNTSGFTTDVKTKSGETVLESLTSNPFFIQSAGSYTLSGTITATGNDQNGTMKVYLMSPMTGPMEATSVDFAGGATATYSFSNLPAGDYSLFTDQAVTLGSKEFTGKSTPDRVLVSGNTTYNFTLSNNSTGTAVTVSIDGPANEPLDIFAGTSTSFKVKQVTLNGTAGSENFTINLGNGEWFLGVGPQMPKGPISGPPATPNYLPPKPINLKVLGASVFENSGTANDGTVAFTLTASNKTIKGVVKDGSNKVMANAEVYAYSPTDGFGTRTSTDTTGAFTLNVVDGSFIVGSFIPGMPPSKEVPVNVNSNTDKGGHATNYLFIGGNSSGVSPATAASTFVLKVAKPDYTISGKVTDGTNVVQGASVYAYRTDGPGNANVLTTSDGTYTLYVSAGTWKVGTFLPQYGQLDEQTQTVTTANLTNINFAPSTTGTYYTVSGQVYKDTNGNTSYDSGEALSNAFVKISGAGTFNEAITATDGTYSFRVPQCNTAACYTITAFAPSVGNLPSPAGFSVTGNVTNKDIRVGALKTVTITLSASVEQAFVELVSADSRSNMEIKNSNSGRLTVPNGSYKVNVFIPGTVITPSSVAATDGTTTYNNSTGVVTVDGSEGVTVTLPTQRTITGTVTDGTNNIPEAWVELLNPSTGVHFGTKTESDGTFSLKAQDGAYTINAMKPGYFREGSSLTVNASTAAQTLTLSAATLSISGQVKVGANGVSNAFIRAEKQGGGFAGTQADASGNYTLYVTDGSWRVYAVGEGYAEAALSSNPVAVSGSSVTGKDITLVTPVTLGTPKSKPITPASGGTFQDSNLGLEITIQPNALGSSSSAGNLEVKETNNYRATSTATPLEGGAREIKATDSEGSPINTLNSAATVDLSLCKEDLDDTNSSNGTPIDTEAEVDQLSMAYWDESTASWVTLLTTINYLDENSDPVPDPASNLSDVACVVITATTDHFSLYAPVVSTDPSAPQTPSGLAATAASTTQINLSWTQVGDATSYDIYRSTTSGGTYSLLGSEPTVGSGSTTTYSDTGLSAGTTYYYKITSLNSSGESAASSAVSATTTSASSGGSGGGGGGGGSLLPSNNNSSSNSTSESTGNKSSEVEEETKESEEVSETKSVSFVDIKNHWAKSFIENLAGKGIVNGYDAEHYGPDNKITRAEFTKIVIEMFDIEVPETVSAPSFKDVKSTDWYVGYLEAALENKLVLGYDDKTFKPNQPINRAEAMKILLEASGLELDTDYVATFPDLDKKSWYLAYINFAAENGIVSGYKDGKFGPGKNLTRGEVAKIASLMLEMTEEDEPQVSSFSPTDLIKSVLK